MYLFALIKILTAPPFSRSPFSVSASARVARVGLERRPGRIREYWGGGVLSAEGRAILDSIRRTFPVRDIHSFPRG